MKVQCSKCESKYNIKDEKIPEGGAKIKCPKCQNIIAVVKPELKPSVSSKANHEKIHHTKDQVADSGTKKLSNSTKKMVIALAVVAAFGLFMLTVGSPWLNAQWDDMADENRKAGAEITKDSWDASKTARGETPQQNRSSENTYVSSIKKSVLRNYPNKTIGEAVDGFMVNPKWKAIRGSDGHIFVNANGYVNYKQRDVQALLQFELDENNNSFQIQALEIDGIPQNDTNITAFLEIIYELPNSNGSKTTNLPNSKTVIQGFYIGMPLTEAVEVLNGEHAAIFKEFELIPLFSWEHEYLKKAPVQPVDIKYKGDMRVYQYDQCFIYENKVINGRFCEFAGDEKGIITKILLSDSAVNAMFNVEDMRAENFVQAFMDAYKIPQMAPVWGDSSMNWEYTSPEGFKITIMDDKSIKMEKVAKAKERNFS